MRLFVAIDADDGVREAIVALRRRVTRACDPGGTLKWVDPLQMHLTLAFLGEVPDPAVPGLLGPLSAPLEQSAFTITFRGLGVFPPRGAPSVLWLGVAVGATEVAALQRTVAARLEGLGMATDGHPFHPHLTLARWRSSRRSRAARGEATRAIAADPGGVIARMGVDHVTLYQSRLSAAGPSYTALARATLR